MVPRRSDVPVLVAVAAAAAFFFVHGIAHRDLLIGYVATLRMADGQLPYRDFFPQVIPLAAALALPIVAVMPTLGTAVLAQAVALNVAMALLVYRLLLHVLGERLPAIAGALLAAVWYLQIGGYYYDQVAYLLAFAAFVRYDARAPGRGPGALEGILVGCAPFAKQSVGTFAALAFVTTVVVFGGWRPLLQRRFVAGLIAPAALAGAYLTALDAWPAFYLYAIQLQVEYGRDRTDLWRLARDFVQPWGLDIVDIIRQRRLGQLAFYPVVLSVYVSYLAVGVALWRRQIDRRLARGYVFLLLSTIWGAATPGRLYTHVTFGFPAIVALSVWLLLVVWRERVPAALRQWVWPATVLPFVAIGIVIAAGQLYADDRGESPVARGRLWPITFDGYHRQAIDLAAQPVLNARNYALFGDLLHALPMVAGRAPLDPMLIYEFGNTIPVDEARRRTWERMFIAHLERVRPDLLVVRLEDPTMGGQADPLDWLPRLSEDAFPEVRVYLDRAYPRRMIERGAIVVRARR